MDVYLGIAIFVGGLILGHIFTRFMISQNSKTGKEIAEEVLKNVEKNFGTLSLQALPQVSEHLIKLADSKLDSKKELIDQQLELMTKELGKVTKVARELGEDTNKKFGEVTAELKNVERQTSSLRETTNSLREALANPKSRGQWGERMAEDVLRIAGFREGINYSKQKVIKQTGTQPDYTFFLPKNKKLHMDVKFPLDNYMKFVESEPGIDRDNYRLAFLKDVKKRIKEVTARGYLEPDGDTLDYLLVFIPNEQIFGFIQEEDSNIFDEALKQKVVCCSPITLFAVLAIVRQSVDNFSIEQTSKEIVSLIGNFKQRWAEFVHKMGKMGEKLQAAQNEYVSLTTTRKHLLEKPLDKIEAIREAKGIAIYQDEDSDVLLDVNKTISEPLETSRFLKDSPDKREELN